MSENRFHGKTQQLKFKSHLICYGFTRFGRLKKPKKSPEEAFLDRLLACQTLYQRFKCIDANFRAQKPVTDKIQGFEPGTLVLVGSRRCQRVVNIGKSRDLNFWEDA